MTAPRAPLYPAPFKGGQEDSEHTDVAQKFQAGTSVSPSLYLHSTAQTPHFLLHALPCSNTNTCSSQTELQQNYCQGRT